MLLLLLPVQCTLKPHSVLQLNVERNNLLRSEITNKGAIGLKRADHKAASEKANGALIEAIAAVEVAQGNVDAAAAAVDEAQDFYTAAAQDYKYLSDAYESAKTENGGNADGGTTEGGSTENGSTGDNSGSAGETGTEQAGAAGENGGNAGQSGTDQTANADGAAAAQGAMPQTGDSTLLEVSIISGMGAAAIAAAGIARRRGLHAAL